MATYSSILAWRIPWTEEPGWLQSMGSQKDMTEQLTLSQVALEVKNLPAHARDAGDTGSIPGSGRYPGEGNGNPFQYSCLENSMDRGAWWAVVHRVAQSWARLK